jgi:anti-sigma regulatory factor (Ser/Thr protein kinase)
MDTTRHTHDHDGLFRHEALLYVGDDEFVERIAAFVREGVEQGEPALVVVAAPKIDRLREKLGADADAVRFADMQEVGLNPARIIPAWQKFVSSFAADVPLRGVGEPIWSARAGDELVECQRHEALLNLAFPDAPLWLVCPYDIEALPAEVVEEARRSHPLVAAAGGSAPSDSYAAGALVGDVLPPAPARAQEIQFGYGGLERLRAFVHEHAARAGLDRDRRIEFVLATNEIASNSLEHGGGAGVLRFWSDPASVVCEISDRGRLDDPLADRRLPAHDGARGRGFWIANHVCDLVQVRSGPDGTVVRLHMTRR